MIPSTYYGTLAEADTYFDGRLHESAWTEAASADRPKALRAATIIIDTLNYKGYKNAVYLAFEADPAATTATIQAAEASQALEFPRGADTAIPEAILIASYEIAHALLDGKDPEQELENLGISAQRLGDVATNYNRTILPVEHVVNGVPSSLAWRLILPFLRDEDAVRLLRVS